MIFYTKAGTESRVACDQVLQHARPSQVQQ
jgi:hypothetical protein